MFELIDGGKGLAKLKVIGVGGGGSNAVNRMIEGNLEYVETIAVNTDAQALNLSIAQHKLQIGMELTKGLGSGGNPEIGKQAAEEDRERMAEILEGADMVFIAAGMGGGTGTGAAPVIASLCKEMGILSVGVVTKPFAFEGKKRLQNAEMGIAELRRHATSVIVIPNDRVFGVTSRDTKLQDSFRIVDSVLFEAVRGIADIITKPGLINVDFADVRTVMSEKGDTLMGTGYSTTENKAYEAAQQAINCPLLEDVSIHSARGVLVNITGGAEMSIEDMNNAMQVIHDTVHEDANVIFGVVIMEGMTGIKVTVIATGIDRKAPVDFSTADMYDLLKETRLGREELDIKPAFTRTERIEDFDFSARVNKNDLDIPTFLRRQMD